MRKFNKFLFLFIVLCPVTASGQQSLSVGVARFTVNGPPQSAYLAGAAQDAIVGSLIQKGYQAHALNKVIDPEKLKSVKQGDKLDGLVVTGRINVVGQNYRVRLKWVDHQGRFGEDYLQVSQLNDLLPSLETFAKNKLQPPRQVLTRKEVKEEKKTTWEKEIVPPPPPVAPKPPLESIAQKEPPGLAKPAPRPPVPTEEKTTQHSKSKRGTLTEKIRDYDFVSDRLPFEVRGLAYGDITGDGHKEVILTSKRKLYVYSFQGGKLELLAEYPGAKIDYFVKVDILPHPQGPYIALTNIRESFASSKVLKYSGGSLQAVAEGIPFQLRVLSNGRDYRLVGSPFKANADKAAHNIFLLDFEGDKVKPREKLKLPGNINLYNYTRVDDPQFGKENVVAMSGSGKVRFYQKVQEKFKKKWTSRESYGGTGNYVPVDMKNIFNEVVGDYYGVPVGVQSFSRNGSPEVVVVKNESVVKNMIGKVPVIGSGYLVRLKYDELGFVETWASKKVDGSIQDYLVTTADGSPQLLAAVRLRDPGLLGDMGRHDSVLLMYHLN